MKQLLAVVLFGLVMMMVPQSLRAQTAEESTAPRTTIIDVQDLARRIDLSYWTEVAGKSSFTAIADVDVAFRKYAPELKAQRREIAAVAEKAKQLLAGANAPTREWLNDLITLADQIKAKDALGIKKTVVKLNDGLKTIALYN